eukprot:1843448-Alexandrium_andersonii.AAC.1
MNTFACSEAPGCVSHPGTCFPGAQLPGRRRACSGTARHQSVVKTWPVDPANEACALLKKLRPQLRHEQLFGVNVWARGVEQVTPSGVG